MSKTILISALAFAAGSTAGFLLGRHLTKKRYATPADAEEAIEFADILAEKQAGRAETDSKAVDSAPDIVGRSSLDGTRTYELNKNKLNYASIHVSVTDAEDSEEDEDGDDEELDPSEGLPDGSRQPYPITEEQFSEEYVETFDKVCVTYYANDETLAEGDEKIDINVVGWDNITLRGAKRNGPYMVYIRNEKLRIDYEVTIELTAYCEEVLGIPQFPIDDSPAQGESPKERKKRIDQARRDKQGRFISDGGD